MLHNDSAGKNHVYNVPIMFSFEERPRVNFGDIARPLSSLYPNAHRTVFSHMLSTAHLKACAQLSRQKMVCFIFISLILVKSSISSVNYEVLNESSVHVFFLT